METNQRTHSLCWISRDQKKKSFERDLVTSHILQSTKILDHNAIPVSREFQPHDFLTLKLGSETLSVSHQARCE